MVTYTSRPRWRHPQSLVNPDKIVVREVQGNGGFEVGQFLTESIGQPGEPAHLHGEVLALDIGPGNKEGN